MIGLFRFSPSRLALVYVALSALVLGLFAIPLWYVWRVNYSTLRTYIDAEDVRRMADIFERGGPNGLAAAIEARVRTLPRDEILLLADPSKARVAGNLLAWPAEVPDSPGTSGLIINRGGSSLRVVPLYVRLPGGCRLLMGRESARFQSLVDLFWYGIAAAAGTVGDLARRVPARGGSAELDTLAQTVNGMLEQRFLSAIKLVAGKKKVSLPADVAIDAEVDLGTTHGVFGLAARLNVSLSGMDRQAAQALVEAALAELQDTLRLVAAKDGGDDVVTIHQDAKVFASRITAGASLAHKLGPGRHAWIQVIDGVRGDTRGSRSSTAF